MPTNPYDTAQALGINNIGSAGPPRRERRRRRQSLRWGAGIAAAALVLAACGGSSTSNKASSTGSAPPSPAKTKLSLITFPGTYYFTDAVAQQEGFFNKENLSVQFIKPQAGTSALQLLLSGTVNGLINDGALSVLAASKGQDIKIVGSIYNKNAWRIYASDKVASLSASNLGFPAAIQALKGKTIGVTSIGAGTDLAVQAIVRAAGMNPSTDVHRVGIGLLQAAVGQFQAGRIDAYVFNQPADSVLGDAHLAHPFFDFATQAPAEFANVPQGTLITTGSYLSGHQAVVQRWITAEEDAMHWIQDPANAQKAGALFASSYGGTVSAGVSTVKFLDSEVYPSTAPGLKVSQSLFNNEVKLLTTVGLLKPGVASYNQIVAPSAQVAGG